MSTSMRRLAIVSGTVTAVGMAMRWRRARQDGRVPFNRMRIAMNSRVNPWLMQRGLAGGLHSEIATIEHIGRKTGEAHATPVHPTLVEDQVWIPLPYGEASQWAQNVIAAGHCQLRVHDTAYELDDPQIVPAGDDPKLAKPAVRVADWLGIKYLRLHRAAKQEDLLTAAGAGAA